MKTVGIIGCGALGSALADGWQRENVRVFATRRSGEGDLAGVTWCRDNDELIGRAQTVVLATKPKDAVPALHALRENVTPDHLLISVAAGVELDTLRNAVGNRTRLLRAMPNVAARAGCAMTALSYEADASSDEKHRSLALFAQLGRVREVDESLLDLYTALAGSGPAFASIALEGFADGAVRSGLPRAQALEVAAQAFLGAAELIVRGMQPSELRDMIATPAGCTVEGLAVLEAGAVRSHFSHAIVETMRKLKNRFHS